MNQNQANIIIILLVIILLVLLFGMVGGRHYGGWGMMSWMHDYDDKEHWDEMREHMGLEENDDTPTSADDAPPGSMHNLPVPPAVAAVRMRAAQELGVPGREILILTAVEKTWPNGCLGLADPDEMCTEALVEGYAVTVEVNGEEYTYRTNSDGSVIRREQ